VTQNIRFVLLLLSFYSVTTLIVAHKCHTTFESNMANNTNWENCCTWKILCCTSKKLCCATFAQHNIFFTYNNFPSSCCWPCLIQK